MEANSKPNAAREEDDDRAEVAIMWFRRDLRVDDNPALAAAQKFAKHVVRLAFLLPLSTHTPSPFLSFAMDGRAALPPG